VILNVLNIFHLLIGRFSARQSRAMYQLKQTSSIYSNMLIPSHVWSPQ